MKAFSSTSTTFSLLGDDGYWEVTIHVTHKKTDDLVSWDTAETSVKTYDRDYDKALVTANGAIVSILKECDYNLFKGKENVEINCKPNS